MTLLKLAILLTLLLPAEPDPELDAEFDDGAVSLAGSAKDKEKDDPSRPEGNSSSSAGRTPAANKPVTAIHEPPARACPVGETPVLPSQSNAPALTGMDVSSAQNSGMSCISVTSTPRAPIPREDNSRDLLPLVQETFARLPIQPSPVYIQPANGWNFVNIPTIVFTDSQTQTLTTTLLGTDVEIEVTPAMYTWDFDDPAASPLTTTDPGAGYPNHTLSHTYTALGTKNITLTTTWTGRFRTTGAPWQTIPGVATTTTSAGPLELVEARAHLTTN